MAADARGLEVGTGDAGVVSAVDDFVARLVRIDSGGERMLDLAAAHPDLPLPRIYAAGLFLFLQTEDARRAAGEHLAAAKARLDGADERVRAFHHAVERWHANAIHQAADAFEALTLRWPRDIAAAKTCEFLYYVLGQQHCGARFRAHMARLGPANPDDPDLLSMVAFAHELCDDFAAAEAAATRSLELAACNPWAEHAFSHLLIRQGRVAEGKQRLEAFMPTLRRCPRVIHCHDAWHLGLLHLEDLDLAAAERLLRDEVWCSGNDVVNEQLDAISLAWRLEMAGGSVGGLWDEVAARIAPRASETFMPFINAHFAYALARAGRDDVLEPMLRSVAARAAADDEEAVGVWKPVGLPVVEAAAAAGRGDALRAAVLLAPVLDALPAIGGSDAQNDLFRQAHLVALRAADRTGDARRVLERLVATKRRTALDELLGQGL
jgi:hypothetical protein